MKKNSMVDSNSEKIVDNSVFHEEIKGGYEFVVTNTRGNHTETTTCSTIEQVLQKIRHYLNTSYCYDLLDTIQIKIERK